MDKKEDSDFVLHHVLNKDTFFEVASAEESEEAIHKGQIRPGAHAVFRTGFFLRQSKPYELYPARYRLIG